MNRKSITKLDCGVIDVVEGINRIFASSLLFWKHLSGTGNSEISKEIKVRHIGRESKRRKVQWTFISNKKNPNQVVINDDVSHDIKLEQNNIINSMNSMPIN